MESQKTPEARPKTSEEIRSYWNVMSSWYTQFMRKKGAKIFSSMVPFLHLETAKKIVEVGCGPGNGIEILLEHTKEAEIYASDFCDVFIDYLNTQNYPRTVIGNYNNEELPYEDEMFDRYVANLSLQIVEKPEKMLQEAYRVLRPEGIAAFSVWADRDACTLYKLYELNNKAVIPPPDVAIRSAFHLGDKNLLKMMVKNAGFKRVLCFTEPYYLYWDADEAIQILSQQPDIANKVKTYPELAEVYMQNLEVSIRKHILEGEEPLCFAAYSSVQVPSSESIQKQWNEMFSWYIQDAQPMTTKIYRSLIPFLSIESARKIAEVGCGSGNGVEILLENTQDADIYASDLSDTFVQHLTDKQYPRTVVGQHNAEQLPYGDGEFDRYVANLSLHIVENPEKMLSEAYRVLKNDGIAAFSVWADRSVNTYCSAREFVGKQVLPKPEVQARSTFRLSNSEELKALVEQAGFRRKLSFTEPNYISWSPEQHVQSLRQAQIV